MRLGQAILFLDLEPSGCVRIAPQSITDRRTVEILQHPYAIVLRELLQAAVRIGGQEWVIGRGGKQDGYVCLRHNGSEQIGFKNPGEMQTTRRMGCSPEANV